MIATGIDLGGTKIETQIFDQNWTIVEKRRVPTPTSYPELVRAICDEIQWARSHNETMPVGIGAAGLIDVSGRALTANLPATGHPIESDIQNAVGGDVYYLNDCRTFTLSEAVFGSGKPYDTVVGIILGTGVGGGACVNQRLVSDPRSIGGEIGHVAAPANLIAAYGLGVLPCGCGRTGCYESYISGPGLTKITAQIIGRHLSPIEIANQRHQDGDIARAWSAWCEIVAEMLITASFILDPDVFVIGGGLSNIAGVAEDLTQAFDQRFLPNFKRPKILIAQGGDSSGGRGAAYAAWSNAVQNPKTTMGWDIG